MYFKYLAVFLCALSFQAMAQTPVRYKISFENRAHYEAAVEVTFEEITVDTLELIMSRSSPGRYALHEFAKNVYAVKGFDSKGRVLEIFRPNAHEWHLSGHDGTAIFKYTIYGDQCDGTYLQIDNTHAHLNSPATFVWARGLQNRAIEIDFEIPDPAWRIATQLMPTETSHKFTAPNFQYFMDSPVEISDFMLSEWTVNSNNEEQVIRLALHHNGTAAELEAYAKLCQAVVQEQMAIWNDLPKFDYGSYTFIVDYLPSVASDGMEHRNSTICTAPRSLEEHAVRNLGTISHEFFHVWNVERLRPKSLEPFDFEHANVSGELWFAEGFTNYYDGLVLKRAQIVNLDRYAKDISANLNAVLNAPGIRFSNPIDMSRQAPFTDAGISNDPKNTKNTFISYYAYGSALGLALDLMIRREFANLSLDDFMRAMWQKYGRPEIPYTNTDVKATLAESTKSSDFADKFFDKHIYGRNWPDYEALLAQAGLALRKKYPGEAWAGPLKIKFTDEGILITEATLVGTPLYEAQIDRDDLILEIENQIFHEQSALEDFIKGHAPGDVITVRLKKNNVEHVTKLRLSENPEIKVVPYEHTALEVTEAMHEFRGKWLTSKSGLTSGTLQRHCPQCTRSYPFAMEYCHFDGEMLKLVLAE